MGNDFDNWVNNTYGDSLGDIYGNDIDSNIFYNTLIARPQILVNINDGLHLLYLIVMIIQLKLKQQDLY